MSSSLEMALGLARRGLSAIPVPRPRPGVKPGAPGDGKVPAIRWAEYQSRKATEAELRVWFEMDQNIAIITGAVPGFWPGWLERPRRQHARRQVEPRPSGDIAARARCYLNALPRPVLGERSDEATFGSACRLIRGFALGEDTAIRLLAEWCPPTFDKTWIAQKVIAATKVRLRAGRRPAMTPELDA